METLQSNVKPLLKSNVTKFQLKQYIANLTRQNNEGQYDERIALYQQELELQERFQQVCHNEVFTPSDVEKKAITAFYSDKKFSITE